MGKVQHIQSFLLSVLLKIGILTQSNASHIAFPIATVNVALQIYCIQIIHLGFL